MKKRALAATSAALLFLTYVSVAQAAPPSQEPVILLEDALALPLHLSVGPGNEVTVSESFDGKLTKVERGEVDTIYSAPGWDVAGSDYRGSKLFFVESQGAGPDPAPLAGSLKSIDQRGNVKTITSELAEHEETHNPDQDVQYGLSPMDAANNPDCVAQMTAIDFPASYTGADVEADSHPYGLAVLGNTAYVADAGANAVLSVNLTSGAISTLAVLPARPAVITPELAGAFGIGACAGLTYGFESVPTDIEVGPDAKLYVGSLPGGPEDASLGARGAVYRVNPFSGAYSLYADNLITPTGIALDGRGNLYVASLFGPGIYKVPAGGGTATLFIEAELAANVEVRGNTLYATIGADFVAPGSLVSYGL